MNTLRKKGGRRVLNPRPGDPPRGVRGRGEREREREREREPSCIE